MAEESQGKVACGGFAFDGDGKRGEKKENEAVCSGSDCTVSGGGVYRANGADKGKANYSAAPNTAISLSSSHSIVFQVACPSALSRVSHLIHNALYVVMLVM